MPSITRRSSLGEKIVRIAAGYLDVPPEQLEFVDGHVRRAGSSIEGPLLDLGQVLELASPTSRYNQGEMGLETTYYFRVEQIPYASGAHAAHITVDPETYKIEVLDYVVAEDVGRVINPLLVRGQVLGAASQGYWGYHPRGLGIRRQRDSRWPRRLWTTCCLRAWICLRCRLLR